MKKFIFLFFLLLIPISIAEICIVNEVCIIGDFLYYDNASDVLNADCNVELYTSDSTIITNQVMNTSLNYYYITYIFNLTGSYFANLNCTLNNETGVMTKEYEVISSTISQGGNGGGQSVIVNNIYQNNQSKISSRELKTEFAFFKTSSQFIVGALVIILSVSLYFYHKHEGEDNA